MSRRETDDDDDDDDVDKTRRRRAASPPPPSSSSSSTASPSIRARARAPRRPPIANDRAATFAPNDDDDDRDDAVDADAYPRRRARGAADTIAIVVVAIATARRARRGLPRTRAPRSAATGQSANDASEPSAGRARARVVERVRGVPEWRAKAVGVADPDGAIAVAVREESPSRVTADVGVDETQEEVARVFDVARDEDDA